MKASLGNSKGDRNNLPILTPQIPYSAAENKTYLYTGDMGNQTVLATMEQSNTICF